MNVAVHSLAGAVAAATLNVVSLCTGGGGLDRALELACPVARTVVCVERESFAVANLVAQMQAGAMAPAAVWSDVRTFNGRPWRGVIDWLIGGIPCQPHSQAGRRQGSKDERDLWSDARRIIVQARPRYVLIENVGGMLTAGADEVPGAKRVLRDLRKLGYQVEIVGVRASEVGLPHERFRIFILGVADHVSDGRDAGRDQRPANDAGCSEARSTQGRRTGARDCALVAREGDELADGARSRCGRKGDAGEPSAGTSGGGFELVDAQGDGRGEGRPKSDILRRRHSVAGDGRASQLVNAGRSGRSGEPEGPFREAQHRTADEWPGGRPRLRPAGPSDVGFWSYIAEFAPRLLPALSRHDLFLFEIGEEGLAAGGDPSPRRQSRSQARKSRRGSGQGPSHWVDARTGEAVHPSRLQAATERALRRVDDGLAPRIDELRMLGNGVSDAQGALAIRIAAHSLARRSAGAAELVRLMEAA